MSEALSSREIEDVLSSIRRLVSDDLRPLGRTTGAVMPKATAGDGDKLLLTPALRVVQSDPVGQDAQTPAIDAVVAAVSAAVDQQVDEWESETGDLAPAAHDSSAAHEASAEMAPMAEDVAEGDWEDHQIDAYAEPVPLRPAPDEAFVAPEEPFEAEALAATAEAELPGWAQSDGAEEAEAVQDDPWVGGPAGVMVEPDRAWADEAEAAVLQELAAATPMAQMPADEIILNESDAPDVPIDEAMLREIVRDVLREELQGRLGERITRNIRKLVRAEIARVMASEEFL